MQNRVEKAIALFNSGYNCAQAVFTAYADIYGIDPETALKLSCTFGGGMAGTREMCGAVSAMTMIAGLETGTAKANDLEGKQYSFDKAQYLMNEFKKENKSVVCQNLLLELEKEPESADGKKRCSKFVKLSAELIEEHLIKNK